jgi:hypothetical protein
MAEMKDRLRVRGKEAVRNLGKVRAGLRGDELDDLRARVDELEQEMQEARQLNLRLAELTDVVQELLLPVAARDEEKISELMERYSKGL